ncbi:hypothetical protein [Aliterella atlantica]|uniref:DUF4352 domain-containing protein n=1 Tax=Aliterella atlantica CENA595 TaxID=1618023 RepID=A0A0D8ZWW5_9CYAN|nr:hypothetical protein [Aliterella atlantica]KJH73253.1 hypothetical protein UH38_00105 [Aliterella atlantica CENA595]
MHSGKRFVLVTTVSSLIFGIATTEITSGSPATLAQTPQQKKPQGQASVVEDNSFKFQLQGCQRTGKNVTCSLLVTNLAEKDRSVTIFARSGSRSFDFSGNEYAAQIAQIGKDQSSIRAKTVLLTGIPVKASVSFELPGKVTQFAALEISYHSDGASKAVFRDIPVTRPK